MNPLLLAKADIRETLLRHAQQDARGFFLRVPFGEDADLISDYPRVCPKGWNAAARDLGERYVLALRDGLALFRLREDALWQYADALRDSPAPLPSAPAEELSLLRRLLRYPYPGRHSEHITLLRLLLRPLPPCPMERLRKELALSLREKRPGDGLVAMGALLSQQTKPRL